jgi:hypothetical protein
MIFQSSCQTKRQGFILLQFIDQIGIYLDQFEGGKIIDGDEIE